MYNVRYHFISIDGRLHAARTASMANQLGKQTVAYKCERPNVSTLSVSAQKRHFLCFDCLLRLHCFAVMNSSLCLDLLFLPLFCFVFIIVLSCSTASHAICAIFSFTCPPWATRWKFASIAWGTYAQANKRVALITVSKSNLGGRNCIDRAEIDIFFRSFIFLFVDDDSRRPKNRIHCCYNITYH